MISHERQFIFIHIHKTAGTSIENKLGLFDKLDKGVQDSRSVRVIQPLNLVDTIRHSTNQFMVYEWLNSIKIYYRYLLPVLTKKQFETYYKFCFVRNSWSRAYSWYSFVMREEGHRKLLKLPKDITLFDFLQRQGYYWGLMTQLDYISTYDGKIQMDFIGRYESLETDFSIVCDKLGVKDPTLPKLLVSGNKNYTEFIDAKSKDLIYKRYKAEINRFKFEFGE